MLEAPTAPARPELDADVLDVAPAARSWHEEPAAHAKPELDVDLLDAAPVACVVAELTAPCSIGDVL